MLNKRYKKCQMKKNRCQMSDVRFRIKSNSLNWYQVSGIRYLLPVICYLSSVICLWAEFNDLGCGARPLGMGSAFVSLADDINAIYYNPAGLVRLKKNEFTSSYGRLYVGLDDDSNLGWGFIGYAQPLGKHGTVGVGYLNFTLLDNYVENTLLLSYSRWVTKRLAMGLNFKILKQKIFQDAYTAIDPVFEYGAKDTVQGFGADAGFIYNLSEKLSFGTVLYNIIQPDMGFLEESKLNLMIKTGLSYRDENVSTALDCSIENGHVKVYAGGEKWFFKRNLAIRSGLAVGTSEFRNFTLGLGYSFSSLQFDYAFLFPIFGINDIYGSHRLSLILRFGAWPRKLKPPEELTPKDVKILKLQKETGELKLKYKQETDELKRTIGDYQKYEDEKVEAAIRREEEKRRKEAVRKKAEAARKKAAAARRKKEKEAARKPSGKTTHKVKKGETLKDIAKKYYGDMNKWRIIYDANTDKIERGKPKAGAILVIPPRK